MLKVDLLDDDQIETILHVQFRNMSLRSLSAQATPIVQSTDNDCLGSTGLPTSEAVHGQAVDGSVACCRRVTDNGVIDCTGCLDEQWASVSQTFSAEEMTVAHAVLSIVGQAGGQGSSKLALAVGVCYHSGVTADIIAGTFQGKY